MGRIWTPERNERLLLLIVDEVKLDHAKIAKQWAEKYSKVDDFQPSARAITEQFVALRKRAGAGGKSGKGPTTGKSSNGTTPKTPNTPKTPRAKGTATAKTPASSGLKRKAKSMTDEDDSEIDISESFADKLKRSSTRSNNEARKDYAKLNNGDDGSDDEIKMEDASPAAATPNGRAPFSMFDHQLDFDGTTESKSTGLYDNIVVGNGKGPNTSAGMVRGNGKKARPLELDSESDVSEYSPFT